MKLKDFCLESEGIADIFILKFITKNQHILISLCLFQAGYAFEASSTTGTEIASHCH